MKPTVSRELFFFFTSFVDILCTALDGFVSLIRGIEQASEKEKKKERYDCGNLLNAIEA